MDYSEKVVLWIIGIMATIALTGMFLVSVYRVPPEQVNEEKTCEDLGGKYVVVDKEWGGKTYINIYGCVK
ncbi:hypothetical protein [Bacillus xiapuensis]|uniref:Uncharacterized protein n=1 Tax=Bacillus xiapuensis TaxID=2014075 RepID=A0ABU6N8D8_9BACI|nr:hypothetical protein [Bacillus xiapuensis]